jgi:hypothetical protein
MSHEPHPIINVDLHSLIRLDMVCFARIMSPPAPDKVFMESSRNSLERAMDEHEPPKGTLIAILIYLLLLVLLWTNVYLHLWVRG